MKHAWTGGQYSLWRALLGAALGAHFVRRLCVVCASPESSPFAIVLASAEIALCVALVLGAWHRVAALLLAAGIVAFPDPSLGERLGSSFVIAALLVLCASTRPAPYLSLPAIGRTDPGGSWILPDWVYACGWILLVAVCMQDIVPRTQRALWDGSTPELIDLGWRRLGWIAYLVPLALGRRWLPFVWLLLLASEVWFAAESSASFRLPIELTLLFAATFDPGWIAPRSPRTVDSVFYDGHCGMCHRFVRFLLAADRRGSAFRFAPLDSEVFRALIPGSTRAKLPDSVIVRTADGRVLVRSRATRHLLSRLGGVWRLVAMVSAIIPSAVLDVLYDFIARVRHKIFARPAEACPLMPAHLRRRFDA